MLQAFVGAFIASTAGLAFGSAANVIISVKSQLSDHVKIRFISQLMAYLKFSKNCLSVLMELKFQHFYFFYYHFRHYHYYYLVFSL